MSERLQEVVMRSKASGDWLGEVKALRLIDQLQQSLRFFDPAKSE
jgi:hypothetical protein